MTGSCTLSLVTFKIWYKPETLEDGSDSFSFGGECIINAPYINPTVVLIQHDLFKEWVPNLKECTVAAKQSVWNQLVHIEVDWPFPVADRDVVIDWSGFILPEKQAMCLMMHSANEPTWYGVPIPEKENDVVRMDLHSCLSYMQYLDKDKTLFKFITNVDFKMKFVPQWLLNFAMSKGVGIWLNKVKYQSEHFEGSEFAKRKIQNPLYRLIEKRLGV